MWSALWGLLASDSEEELQLARMAELEQQEREFHSWVRQQIVCFILLIFFYLVSYWLISKFKAKNDHEFLYAGDDDYLVYRVSVWICTFSLTVSIGSVALLPFSVLGSELLQRYPDNYYLQWLSWSLINSLWNYVFILANLSLFVLLPFSYFFIESFGFLSTKTTGLTQRIYETISVCALFIVLLLCIGDVLLSVFNLNLSIVSLTSVNLPLVYSCVSLFGVMLLLVSTPLGFARMFTIVSEKASRVSSFDSDDKMVVKLESKVQAMREERQQRYKHSFKSFDSPELTNRLGSGELGYRLVYRVNGSPVLGAGDMGDLPEDENSSHSIQNLSNSMLEAGDAPSKSLFEQNETDHSFLKNKSLKWYQELMMAIKYPVTILLLLAFSGVSLLMVIINSLKLMFGFRSLPVYAQYMEVQTRHTFGLVGVIVETIIILYVMATSLVGVYSIPFVSSIRPKWGATSLTNVIINCSLVLILSSALPVLANTLGITTFDLLGAYSALEWLSNFRLVLAYNVLFAAATILCFVTQITAPMRRQIMRRMASLRFRRFSIDEFPEKLD